MENVKIQDKNKRDNVKYMHVNGLDYVKSIILIYGFLESALKINKILRCFIYSNSLNMYCRNFNIDLTKKFLLFECFY